MNPTVTDVHVSQPLRSLSIAYKNAARIWSKVFPVVPVEKDYDKYFIMGKENLDINDTAVLAQRAPGDSAEEIEWKLSNDVYQLVDHAKKAKITDEVVNNQDAPLDVEKRTLAVLDDQIDLIMEYIISNLCTTSGNYAASHSESLSGGDMWDVYDSSDPLLAIQIAMDLVHSKIFVSPNTLVLGYPVWSKLKYHSKILGLMKSGISKLTLQILSDLLEIPNIIIGEAGANTAHEGQTASNSYLWGKNACLLYVPPSVGLETLSFGLTFMDKKSPEVLKWRDADASRKTGWMSVSKKMGPKVTESTAGYLFQTCVS